MLARVGRAQQLVKPERYEDFARAALSLVHRGMASQLSNTAGAAEQVRPQLCAAVVMVGGALLSWSASWAALLLLRRARFGRKGACGLSTC